MKTLSPCRTAKEQGPIGIEGVSLQVWHACLGFISPKWDLLAWLGLAHLATDAWSRRSKVKSSKSQQHLEFVQHKIRLKDFQTTNIGCKGTFTFQINGKLRIKQNQPSITTPCDPRISSHDWTPRPARRWVFLVNTCTIEARENQGIQPLTISHNHWICEILYCGVSEHAID